MCKYNLIKYGDIYWKTSGSLWQYYRDESVLDNNNNIIDFLIDSKNSISFKFKQKQQNDGTKDIEIIILLRYLSNFRRAYEMSLINCEINLKMVCKMFFSR